MLPPLMTQDIKLQCFLLFSFSFTWDMLVVPNCMPAKIAGKVAVYGFSGRRLRDANLVLLIDKNEWLIIPSRCISCW